MVDIRKMPPGTEAEPQPANPRDVETESRVRSGPPFDDATDPAAAPRPGDTFGPYRIISLLGRGGMGVVFEAEETESGRRVALKVLSTRLSREIDRERFLREARLAASINHPHCVFVFGACGIAGQLVIAMELMQETLRDRLARQGPFSTAAAIDAILDVIVGLDAAAATGILHRDVKPANCFVDEQGRVRIGDFGISISAHPSATTGLATQARIVGTPAFAAPEQLRGVRVDHRSDIYGVGATLYTLLTDRLPFEQRELMTLLMAVANDEPPAPHDLNRSVPRGLSTVVLRCLAKSPGKRFRDSGALVEALQPYSSAAARPAPLGLRMIAGIIDYILLFIFGFVHVTPGLFTLAPQRYWIVVAAFIFVRLGYYGLSEGLWGASPGKALCGIRVVRATGPPASVPQVLSRTGLFAAIGVFPYLVLPLVLGFQGFQDLAWSNLSFRGAMQGPELITIALGLLFGTARRQNGYAALHDLATSTRVVERRPRVMHAQSETRLSLKPTAAAGRAGPYEIVAAQTGVPPDWQRGVDLLLLRDVWIRPVSAETPAVPAARRAVNRPTRLRWLAGRRLPGDSWDVYSSVRGQPLADALHRTASWEDVRRWLLALARECLVATREGTLPPLRLDRVWVTRSGGATLVDDPALDATDPGSRLPAAASPPEFLSNVAQIALGRVPRDAPQRSGPPLPASAERLVQQLAVSPGLGLEATVSALERLARQPPMVTSRWRGLAIGLCAVPLVALTGLSFQASTRMSEHTATLSSDLRVVATCLHALADTARGSAALSPDTRQSLELVLAGRYRHVLTDRSAFRGQDVFPGLGREHFSIGERILQRYPVVDEARIVAAEHAAAHVLERAHRPPERPSPISMVRIIMVPLLVLAQIALVASLVFRGGVLRMLGLEVVGENGLPASRPRFFARTLLTWSPVLLLALVRNEWTQLAVYSNANPNVLPDVVAIAIMVLGGVLVLANPGRGLHDWVTRTRVVPR